MQRCDEQPARQMKWLLDFVMTFFPGFQNLFFPSESDQMFIDLIFFSLATINLLF